MLSIREVQILDACADHYELFYFPFAMVNYGGQVVRRDSRMPDEVFKRFEDEGPWKVEVPGEVISRETAKLVRSGLLRCWRVADDPLDPRSRMLDPMEQISSVYERRVETPKPDEEDFSIYAGYDCVTFDEHMERFGYGPHEFRTTKSGVEELHRPVYDDYARELGWT